MITAVGIEMLMETSTLQPDARTHGIASTTEERALVLLGKGYDAKIVASACGVSESRISQLLSDDSFKAAVTELRFGHLQAHNEQDSSYDSIEKVLTDKFKAAIPLMMRPMEILKGLQVINQQKRRGASAPETILQTQQVVSITLPSIVINNFTNAALTTNIHNQVVKVGDTDLTTMQSGTLLNTHKREVEASSAVLALTSTPQVIPNDSSSTPYKDPTLRKYEDI